MESGSLLSHYSQGFFFFEIVTYVFHLNAISLLLSIFNNKEILFTIVDSFISMGYKLHSEEAIHRIS